MDRSKRGGLRSAESSNLNITPTCLPGMFLLTPKRFQDPRGFFTETYNKRRLAEFGITTDFVQDNLSLSEAKYTLRGIHFQKDPFAQAKLVSVAAGAVLDVVVDLRRSSPCFGKHFAALLSAEEGNQLFVPVGVGHAFLTLDARHALLLQSVGLLFPRARHWHPVRRPQPADRLGRSYARYKRFCERPRPAAFRS